MNDEEIRACNRDNLAKTIDPAWTTTQVLQRLIAHYDEYTDVFEGEEISLEMAERHFESVIVKTMAQFGLKKGVKYDVKATEKVIVITPSAEKIKEVM